MAAVYNVPMGLDLSLSHTEGLDPFLATMRNRKHVQQAREHTVGPMPAQAFIETFLQPRESREVDKMSSREAFKAVPQGAESSPQIYEPLVAALNRASKRKARCPGFVFEKTIERSVRPLRPGYTKPHVCCFTTANARLVRSADMRSRIELGYAELFINIEPSPDCDFFVDPPADAEPHARSGHEFVRQFDVSEVALYDRVERAFGLHVAFVMEIFARQNRLVVFSVSMAGSLARLLRWDRAGCIVTEAFDIREQPELLLDFLWRFSQVSRIERGHDPTVTPALPQEEIQFREAIQAYVRSQLEVEGEQLEKAVSAHYLPGHVTAVGVYSTPASATDIVTSGMRFVVSRPVVSPLYLEGRGTRGYWALCCDTGRIVFLKDTWRSASISELEGGILGHLNDLGVRNVPRLVIHSDMPDEQGIYLRMGVRFQTTRTSYFAKAAWRCPVDETFFHISRRRHYRLVTDTAGYGLNTVRGTQELLHATHDAFMAMQDALSKDSRIHRDISAGNIILVREPGRVRRGYLIDWEASDRVDEAGEATHSGRAGTWDFMSIRMLEAAGTNHKHTFKDDMEALLYVVLYCGLRYLAHDSNMRHLTGVIQDFFRLFVDTGEQTWGGAGKMANAHDRRLTRAIRFRSAALQDWLTTVMNYHSPTRGLEETFKDMWEATHLDAFWSEFLEARVLDCDDRVLHQLSHSGQYDTYTRLTPSAPVTTSDGPASSKRNIEPSEHGNAAGPNPKKARSAAWDSGLSRARLPRAGIRGNSPAAAAVRRSERIRSQQSRLRQARSLSSLP